MKEHAYLCVCVVCIHRTPFWWIKPLGGKHIFEIIVTRAMRLVKGPIFQCFLKKLPLSSLEVWHLPRWFGDLVWWDNRWQVAFVFLRDRHKNIVLLAALGSPSTLSLVCPWRPVCPVLGQEKKTTLRVCGTSKLVNYLREISRSQQNNSSFA